MILPSNNISILDVRQLLNEPSTDLGTLCTSNNINIFSKWKPIDYNGTTITAALLEHYPYTSAALSGGSNNESPYGITVTGCGTTSYSSIENLISAIKKNGASTYHSPTGGASSPYRLGDFRNYNHNAVMPIIPMGERNIKNGGSAVTQLASIVGDGDDTSVGINDLYDYYDGDSLASGTIKLYRGIYLVYEQSDGTTKTDWCIGKINWSNTSIFDWRTGNADSPLKVTCYDFLTNVTDKTLGSTSYTSSGNDRFYAVISDALHPNPYTWYLTGEDPDNSYPYEVIVSGVVGLTKGYLAFNVQVTAEDDAYTGATITNLEMHLYGKQNVDNAKEEDIDNANINILRLSLPYTLEKGATMSWGGMITIPSAYQSTLSSLRIEAITTNNSSIKTVSSGKRSVIIPAQLESSK